MQSLQCRSHLRVRAAGLCRGRKCGTSLPQRIALIRLSAATDVVETSTEVATSVPKVLVEINQSNFYSTLEAAGDSLVVVDFFTDWCGPCKMIYPDLVKMSEELSDVKFYKLNCNKANKDLGKKLQIRVAPTFHLYRRSEKVAEMTGAKVDKLRALINEHM